MKDKIKTEYFRRVKKLVKLELYARNIIMGINWWVLGLVRYSAGVVDWARGDIELSDRKRKKILTCNGLLYPRANDTRLYLKGCKRGRGLMLVKDCVLSEYNRLWDRIDCQKNPC